MRKRTSGGCHPDASGASGGPALCERWPASAAVGSKTAPPNGRRRHVHPQKLRSGETDCCKLAWDSALPLFRPQRHHPIRPARPTGRENDAKRSRRRPARPPSPKSAGRGRSRRIKSSAATARRTTDSPSPARIPATESAIRSSGVAIYERGVVGSSFAGAAFVRLMRPKRAEDVILMRAHRARMSS